jgi:hypothetical protein
VFDAYKRHQFILTKYISPSQRSGFVSAKRASLLQKRNEEKVYKIGATPLVGLRRIKSAGESEQRRQRDKSCLFAHRM